MKAVDEFSLPRRWGTLRPRFIVSLVALLALLGVAGGYVEITQSRREVMELLRREGETVTDALSISAENAVQAYGEIEAHIEQHLFNAAYLLKHLHAEHNLSQREFRDLMRENGVARSFYVKQDGRWQTFAYPTVGLEEFWKEGLARFIQPLFRDDLEKTSGYVRDWEGQNHFAIALKATARTAWVLCANPGVLLDLRRRVGLGRLIQDVGENKEIAYIVLQDEKGIIAATSNITSMASLRDDPFLRRAISSNRLNSRVTQFGGKDVFETVTPFAVNGQLFGLIRVGLQMDAVNEAVTRTIERAILVAFGFIIIGVVLFNFLVSNQNYNLLTEAYAKMRTYTGNILENMADAVVAVNRDGRITLFNRAAEHLFNKSAKSVIGKSCRDIIGEQTSLLDKALATGKGVEDEEVSYDLDGKKSILSVTTTLLRDSAGEVDSAVAVIKDLTEKKNWEERLRRQEKLTAMGELASGVAHEIRNPLNAIGIVAQRFASEFTPTERQQEFRDLANSVISATRQVSSIIERFLKFARPPKLDLQRQRLKDVVTKVVTLVESEAQEKGVRLHLEVQDDLELMMDGGQMEEVLLNLLQNSLHATSQGDEINLKVVKQNGEAVVEVSDTGEGIPPEHLDRIFDLYFTTKEKGTGMGLSVSHRIVTEHGGRLTVSSEVGLGTTFRIILPLSGFPAAGDHVVAEERRA
ncbi:MAG: PAS domain-containing protein [Calditrichaeota bacterium]|nr:MAG: PAS domain-containing protein [Calditrichota bacterium]